MNANAFVKVDKATFYRFIVNAPDNERYEFVRGRIMQQQQGGTLRHAQIGKRFVAVLDQALDRARWLVSGSDRGIDTGPTVRYADAVAEPVGADPDSLSTEKPVVIVEVLSKFSEDRDLDVKPAEYLVLPTLEAYIVASQNEPACYLWVRGADRQFPSDPVSLRGFDKSIDIVALSLSIPLREIYR